MRDTLYYGDNLTILREHVADESVDLIYLDPPFNSNASYNVLFKAPEGHESHAQMEAFDDTWHWGEAAEKAFDEVVSSGNTDAAEMLRAMRSFLKENDMMAYLAMMAVRLLELHRVLKPTGSLYLHCDPTASHYLKILLDAVFGKNRYLNEIVWKRTSAHNDPNRFGRIADRIFYYSKSKERVFNPVHGEYSEEQRSRYKHQEGDRWYKAENLTAPHFSETRTVEWRGTHPGQNRQWRFGLDELEALWSAGKVLKRRDGAPRKDGHKEYLDEQEGAPAQDIWTDIIIGPTSGERLGYPTQKPIALLERILSASSKEGDLVLDPFCGCGTTVHAAQKLKRRWIGIDVTNLAVSLIQKRLRDAFRPEELDFDVLGVPKDMDGARALAEADKYQFQWWAVSLVDAVPFGGKKKGADGGIDGYIYFKPDGKTTEKAVVSVKGGANVGVGMIRDLIATIDRDRARMGVLVSLAEPTREMVKEAAAAGLYKTEYGEYPKVQIRTIDQLLAGNKPVTPWVDPSTFRKAKREMKGEQGSLL